MNFFEIFCCYSNNSCSAAAHAAFLLCLDFSPPALSSEVHSNSEGQIFQIIFHNSHTPAVYHGPCHVKAISNCFPNLPNHFSIRYQVPLIHSNILIICLLNCHRVAHHCHHRHHHHRHHHCHHRHHHHRHHCADRSVSKSGPLGKTVTRASALLFASSIITHNDTFVFVYFPMYHHLCFVCK